MVIWIHITISVKKKVVKKYLRLLIFSVIDLNKDVTYLKVCSQVLKHP